MSELKVLSKEEVDALIKASGDNSDALQQITSQENGLTVETWSENNSFINTKALNNIANLLASECEKGLTTLLRKKALVHKKEITHGKVSECLSEKMEKHVFSVFQINDDHHYGMVAITMPLLHHTINLLYGGTFVPTEEVIETPGKIGLLVASKMSQICLNGFCKASEDYGKITCSAMKSITEPNLTSKLSMDDAVSMFEMDIVMGELETKLAILIKDSFLREFIPSSHKAQEEHVDSNFWRAAIETQVADSVVEVRVTLPDVKIKMSELMKLKSGDMIPISDPTVVYVCLNDLKLFRANAGQANSKRVAKVIKEI